MSKKKLQIHWLEKPAKNDFLAAQTYLSLIFDSTSACEHVEKLRKAPMSSFKAKDLLRASALSRLGVSNSHVERDREKIRAGEALSPILLVRDSRNAKLTVADGYHRICAVYSLDEDAVIPSRIV